MKVIKNLLLVTLPVTLILIVILELVLARFFYVPDPYLDVKVRTYNPFIPSEYTPGLHYQLESKENLPGLESSMVFSTNNLGFRGDKMSVKKPESEFRIFLIGGSTTACFYLDDSKSLDHVLQAKLGAYFPGRNIKVYNAGKPGDASPDHVAMLSQKIVHLQPDLIVVFAGLNDFIKTVLHYDYAHLSQRPFPNQKSGFFQKATRFQIPRRIYYAMRRTEKDRQKIRFSTDYRTDMKLQQSVKEINQLPDVNTSGYEKNLRSIAGIAKENQIDLVFMSNQSTWNSKTDTAARNYHWLCLRNGKRYSEQSMDSGLVKFNRVMEAVATNTGLSYLNLPALVPKSLDYFYDDCHFNVKGAATTGSLLADFIAAKGYLK